MVGGGRRIPVCSSAAGQRDRKYVIDLCDRSPGQQLAPSVCVGCVGRLSSSHGSYFTINHAFNRETLTCIPHSLIPPVPPFNSSDPNHRQQHARLGTLQTYVKTTCALFCIQCLASKCAALTSCRHSPSTSVQRRPHCPCPPPPIEKAESTPA